MFPHLLLLCIFTSNALLSASSSDPYFDTFAKCLAANGVSTEQTSSILHSPTSPSFTQVLDAHVRNLRFNTSSSRKPSIIVTPSEPHHVQAAVLCTKQTGLQLKIRSGGHDFEGISYVSSFPFVILDMFNLRSISIDVSGQTAWVQSGATLGELYYRIAQESQLLGFPAGVCPTVAVGGHLSGGGYGAMLRKHGLATDNVVDAEVVDVFGRILDRKGMGEDLFWAIRGGGGASFCVILSYKIKLVPVPATVTVFQVFKTVEQNAAEILFKWQNVADKIDNDLFIRAIIEPITVKAKKQPSFKIIRVAFNALFLGDANRLISVMNLNFPELGLQKTDCSEMSWIQSIVSWANFKSGPATPTNALLRRSPDSVIFGKKKSDYVQTPLSLSALQSLFRKMIELGKTSLVFNPYGGRMSEIAADATPFPHRAGIIFKIQYSVSWVDADPRLMNQYIAQTRDLYSFMTPYVSKNPRRAFVNYRDLDIGSTDNGKRSYGDGHVYGVKYFKDNFYRLVKIKSAVDPLNFFRNEQSIPTLPLRSSNGRR